MNPVIPFMFLVVVWLSYSDHPQRPEYPQVSGSTVTSRDVSHGSDLVAAHEASFVKSQMP